MTLERNMLVKLKPNNKIYEKRNWIVTNMKEYLGAVVTVTSTNSDDRYFLIREDGGNFFYSEQWIDFIVDDVSIK